MKKHLVIFLLFISNVAASQSLKGIVYTTAANKDYRITKTEDLSFKPFGQPLETDVCVFIDTAHKFQTLIGIGGALTDASAETFAKLPLSKQEALLEAYFDPQNGIGYTLARTSIHSCDFSSGSYTYVKENDSSLSSFSIAPDTAFRIPFIKRAIAAAGGKLTLYVSPWSPPSWMKDNNSMLKGGKLLPKFRQPWANYYVRFIKAYEKAGIPIWGLTVQNEPMATQRWESCIFTATEERDFIKGYLGPTLQKNGLGNKKLIAWDHNRDLIYQRANTILSDPKAAKYVWGIGYHWYETWTGSAMQFDNVKQVAAAFPSTNLIFTEGSIEKFDSSKLTDWSLGEKYGYSMINDLNCGVTGWTDWNILLDEHGGPNHVANYCFAPVIANTKNGELLFTNAYYYIGHFAKFIRPGARRISCSSNRDKLQATAFKNTDGTIVVVVMNATDNNIPYHLWMNENAVTAESLPHSIATVILNGLSSLP